MDLSGNELLEVSNVQKQSCSTTLDKFIYGLIKIYEKHVYCEGFQNAKDQKKFEQEAREFVSSILG